MIPTPDILNQIAEKTLQRLALSSHELPREQLEILAQASVATRRDFLGALRTPATGDIGLIAEIKKASPSQGKIGNIDPTLQARRYELGGADAISVLTEPDFFGGSLADLWRVRQSTQLPILRKDFILDEYQIIEAAARGADAVLLIAALLKSDQLQAFQALALEYRLASLVEVHTPLELDLALAAKSPLIGINARDLHTFDEDLSVVDRLARSLPEGVFCVAESGIRGRTEVERVRQAGAQAVLVGTSLVRAPSPEDLIRQLKGVAR